MTKNGAYMYIKILVFRNGNRLSLDCVHSCSVLWGNSECSNSIEQPILLFN